MKQGNIQLLINLQSIICGHQYQRTFSHTGSLIGEVKPQTLKAPGVIKEMLLWSKESDLSDGRVPKARSDKNLSLFFSRLMAEASQGNSLGRSARLARSHRTLQLLSCVQEQDGGQALTQAQRAMTP